MISIEENVESLIDSWKFMTSRFAGSKLECGGGVTSVFANIELPFLNVSLLDRPAIDETDLRALLQTMQQRAKTCPHHSMIALCEDWIPQNGQEIATDEGFTFALYVTGMAADGLLPARRHAPELEYRRVQDDATARDLAMINALAYGTPTEMWEGMCNTQLWQSDSYAYVGYNNGRAVSCAAALPVNGTMYIALVATLPEEHGKGYAEAVMRKAIEQGQAGMGTRRIILHASDMGMPLYRSMGFATGGRIPLFSA